MQRSPAVSPAGSEQQLTIAAAWLAVCSPAAAEKLRQRQGRNKASACMRMQVGIAFEVRSPGSTQGAAFVVAAKELQASILAGSQVRHQLQSGAGPLTVQVRAPAHSCHAPVTAKQSARALVQLSPELLAAVMQLHQSMHSPSWPPHPSWLGPRQERPAAAHEVAWVSAQRSEAVVAGCAYSGAVQLL